jgi:hypothetical protein
VGGGERETHRRALVARSVVAPFILKGRLIRRSADTDRAGRIKLLNP